MKLLHEAINPRSPITQRALQCFGAPLSQFVSLAQQSLLISFKRVLYSCKLRHEESLTVGHLAAACFSAFLSFLYGNGGSPRLAYSLNACSD